MNKSDELRSEAKALADEIDTLSKIEDPTDEQTARFEAALGEVDPLEERIAAAVAAEERRSAIDAKLDSFRTWEPPIVAVERGDGARISPVVGAKSRNIYDLSEARMVSDSPESFVSEIRSRAATAIEQSDKVMSDEMREQATRLMEQGLVDGDPDKDVVARRWLAFGNPEYREQWKWAMKGDQGAQGYCMRKTLEFERAAWAVDGTTTTGGFAIVPDYDTTLLLINAGVDNPFRQISSVIQTNSNIHYGLSSAGVTAEWISESTEAADATPTVAQPVWNVQRATAYLQASFETIEDTDLGASIAMLIGDAKDQLEAAAFATGTGGGQPFGVVTRCSTLGALAFGESGSTVEKAVVLSDVYNVDNALGPRWRQNASWMANKTIFNTLRNLGDAAGNNYWVDFGGAMPSKLIGYPTYLSSAMDTTIVSGSADYVLLLGDFRNGYKIVDRVGMQMRYNPLVIGSNRRPTGEVGWFAYWRTAGDVTDQTNASHFRLLRK